MGDIQSLATIPALAALIVAIVQALKGAIQAKYVPILALGVGVFLGVVIGLGLNQIHDVSSLVVFGLFGLLSGLTSTGLYEATVDKIKVPKA